MKKDKVSCIICNRQILSLRCVNVCVLEIKKLVKIIWRFYPLFSEKDIVTCECMTGLETAYN